MGASSSVSHDAPPKIFAVSDIHTDEEENWTLMETHISDRIEKLSLALSQSKEPNPKGNENDDPRNEDVLIVAGDISSKTKVIRSTLPLSEIGFTKMALFTYQSDRNI